MQRIDTDAKAAEFEAAASEAADMSDEELAAAQARSEVLRRQKLANDRADLEVRRQEAIAEDVADREKALAQLEQKFAGLEQKWQELGQQKIDTGRWWSNRSTGQKAAAYIAAAIHGFMNPGEPNPALAMMERAIDRDIAAQRADLETGRASLEGEGNLVAKFARLTGDIGEAAQAAKIAALDAAEREVTHRAAAFDPAGTAAREAERAARAIRAAKAEALAKMKAEQIEALQKLAEERRKEREFQEDQRQAREREKIARWKAAIDSRAQKQREKEFDAEFGLKERDRDLAEAKLAEQGTLYNPLTSKPMATVRGLYADDPKAMKDLQERVSGHAMLIESMDELGRLVDDAGGRFDIDEPTLRAKANAILTDLSMAKAKILSGADATDDQIERIKKTFGGVKGLLSMDLSDPNAVLNQTRRRSHRELELKLKGAGVKIGRDRNTGKYTGEMAEFFNDLEAKAPTAGMPETARAKRMARMPKPQAESMAGQHMRQKAAKDALAGVYGSFSEKQSRPGEADVTPELEALQEIGSDTSVDPEIRADAQRKAYSILELTGDQKKGLEWLRDLDARVISDDKMNELIREYNDLVRSTESEKTMGLVEELK